MSKPIDDPRAHRKYPLNRSIFIFLVVLSLGGVAIMDYSVKYGLLYWVAMAVISGGISVALAWRHAAEAGESAKGHFGRQALHWLTLIVGLLLVFFLQNTNTLAPETSGLMALLMLALTTTLAGVHFHARLGLLGGIQAATFVAAVLSDDFFWVLLILILLVVLADILLRTRKNNAPQ